MNASRPSRTAEHNALFRAVEYARRPQNRIVDDWLAKEFLGMSLRFVALLSRIHVLSELLCRYIDYRWPGARTSVIARTRWIDDYVSAALARGVSQIVILGAGFDSRAYRISGSERARFFEVDHPNTSASKIAHIRRIFGALREHVRYVPVNFQSDDLRRALESFGFNPQSGTLLIWEGVSNYLTEETVRKTLTFIASLGEGTTLIFTYVDRRVIEAPKQFIGASEVQRLFAKLGEPWTFGLCPNSTPQFFRQCGLCLDTDLSAVDYREPYYGTTRPIKGYEFYHLIRARVARSEDCSSIRRAGEVHHA
jgi:methyltransferase (TIGR00027 family)